MRVFALFSALLLLFGASASAETVTFRVKSDHPYIVQIKFYSQNRNHVWPSAAQAYELRDSEYHNYSLTCLKGEKICFGAWDKGNPDTYWGSGPRDKFGCQNCCQLCESNRVKTTSLNAAPVQTVRRAPVVPDSSDDVDPFIEAFVGGAAGIMNNTRRNVPRTRPAPVYRPPAQNTQRNTGRSQGLGMDAHGRVSPCDGSLGNGSCAWR